MYQDTLITKDIKLLEDNNLNFELQGIISSNFSKEFSLQEQLESRFQAPLIHDIKNDNLFTANFTKSLLRNAKLVTLKISILPDFKISYLNIDNYRIIISDPKITIFTSFENDNFLYSVTVGKVVTFLMSNISYLGVFVSVFSLNLSSSLISYSQSLKIISLIRYININFGFQAEEFIDNLSGFQNEKKNNVQLQSYSSLLRNKNMRGKLTIKKVALFSENKYYYFYSIYIISSIVKLLVECFLQYSISQKKVQSFYFYIIFYMRKYHFIIFNLILCELYFEGIRTLLHARYSQLENNLKIKFFLTLFALILSLLDIRELLFTIMNIRNPKDDSKPIKMEIRAKPKIVKSNKIQSRKQIQIKSKSKKKISKKSKKLKMVTRKTIDFKKTIQEIKKNKAIIQYIQNRYEASKEQKINKRLISIIGGIFYLRLFLVQVSIITLQYLPTFAVLIFILTEVLELSSQIYILSSITKIQIKILAFFRSLSATLIIIFCIICLFIIINSNYPSKLVQKGLMIAYLMTITIETLDLIFINLIIFKDMLILVYKNCIQRGNEQKINKENNDKDDNDDEYNVLYFQTSKVLKLNIDLNEPISSMKYTFKKGKKQSKFNKKFNKRSKKKPPQKKRNKLPLG